MKFEVTILGNSSATPMFNRNPTSQVLNINEHLLMIDCGEGTQQQLLRYGIRYNKIHHIFISHLHGDHFFGLIGLISSMSLNGRKRDLKLFGPKKLMDIIHLQLQSSDTHLSFKIDFFPLDPENTGLILETRDYTVETIPLNHRIPCTGFIFREKKRQRKILKDRVDELQIPPEYFPLLKRGIDCTDSRGKVFKALDLTEESETPKSYAYCSDTMYDKAYISRLTDVNTLYHETTFMHDMIDRAKETHHTTAIEAAQIAKEINAEKLLIGHFSARYKDLSPLLLEAKTVFEDTFIAEQGETFTI
ncbi:ribonuclease Z [Pseudopedobacter beijingensis]|uniref:Ribonuclease Z n=1 Tax=Pseudopedobacter beijingensis TaxID=1207056 RepID=A0ABW4II96_9SPHI